MIVSFYEKMHKTKQLNKTTYIVIWYIHIYIYIYIHVIMCMYIHIKIQIT